LHITRFRQSPICIPHPGRCSGDESGSYLIFEVNGQRLWGYDVFNKKPLTPAELRTIKIPKVKSEDLGFQAPWPDKTAD
jgi:hypothetical protein